MKIKNLKQLKQIINFVRPKLSSFDFVYISDCFISDYSLKNIFFDEIRVPEKLYTVEYFNLVPFAENIIDFNEFEIKIENNSVIFEIDRKNIEVETKNVEVDELKSVQDEIKRLIDIINYDFCFEIDYDTLKKIYRDAEHILSSKF